jgi:hypothetical protein
VLPHRIPKPGSHRTVPVPKPHAWTSKGPSVPTFGGSHTRYSGGCGVYCCNCVSGGGQRTILQTASSECHQTPVNAIYDRVLSPKVSHCRGGRARNGTASQKSIQKCMAPRSDGSQKAIVHRQGEWLPRRALPTLETCEPPDQAMYV